MKIIVKEDEHNIRLRIPSGLVLNRFAAGAICREAEKHGVRISRNQMRALIKALNHYRRAHPEWILAEVNGAKGEYIQVKL
ncbi:MAG: hypothetical protein IKB09_11480 [Oscillospiraceae bacterium]|nr:hypothetical protein [Oscillospiraceae bacterium]